MKAYKFPLQPRSFSRDRRNTKPYQKCWFIDFLQENHNFLTTVEPLLTTTPDARPPCLWWTLTLVPPASPFRIVLKKPLFCGHLSTLYNDSFCGPNCTQTKWPLFSGHLLTFSARLSTITSYLVYMLTNRWRPPLQKILTLILQHQPHFHTLTWSRTVAHHLCLCMEGWSMSVQVWVLALSIKICLHTHTTGAVLSVGRPLNKPQHATLWVP